MSSQQGPNAVNLRWEAAQMRKEWRARDRAERVRQLENALAMHLYRTAEQRLALIARLVLLREQGVTP